MAQSFFNPESPFGALENWEVQNDNPATSQDRAQALGADGDEIMSQLHNARTTVSCTYVAKATTAKIPKGGAVLNGWHIDSISVAYTNTGFAVMTLNGHKHGAANHPACRTYTGSLTTVGTLFGCPNTIAACTIPTGAGVRTATWSMQLNHVDELDSAGNFLAADNYDGSETWQVELSDDGVLAASTGWDATSVANTRSNTAIETASGTFEKHIKHDAAA